MPTEEEYKKACIRLEEVIDKVDNNTPVDDPNLIELLRVSDVIEKYENSYYNLDIDKSKTIDNSDYIIIKVWGEPNWYYYPNNKRIFTQRGKDRVVCNGDSVPPEVLKMINKITG